MRTIKTKIKNTYEENRGNLRTIEKFTMNKLIPILASIFVFTLIMIAGFEKTDADDITQTKEVKHTLEVKKGIEKVQIKYNNRLYNAQVWWDRVETMRNLGYSETRILDLLAIMNMECGSYKGDCFNGNDIGPMQINKIHKEQYNKSGEFYNNEDWGGLFVYQLQYANQLVQSYEDRFCGRHIFDLIGKEYTNQRRWNCVGKSYNGHPRYKYTYVDLGWDRREEIKKIMGY